MELVKHNVDKYEFVQVHEIKEFFSDIIEVKVIDDAVCLKFATKDPDNSKAIIQTKVYVTLNHFIRFSEVCKNTSDFVVKNIEEIVPTSKK